MGPNVGETGLLYLVNFDESFDFPFNFLASPGMIFDPPHNGDDQIVIITSVMPFSVPQILLSSLNEVSFF